VPFCRSNDSVNAGLGDESVDGPAIGVQLDLLVPHVDED
jgi:hypothetical protein